MSVNLTPISPKILNALNQLAGSSLATDQNPKIHVLWEINGWDNHASYDDTSECKKYFLQAQLEILSQTDFLRQGLLDKCLNFISVHIRNPACQNILTLRNSILKGGTGNLTFAKTLYQFIENNSDRFYEEEEEYLYDFFYIKSFAYQEQGEWKRFTIDLKSDFYTDLRTLQNPSIRLPEGTSFRIKGKDYTITLSP